MIFSVQDLKDAYAEAYQWALRRAGPLDHAAINDMFGELNEIDRSTSKGYLLHELVKADIAYLCQCFKEGKHVNDE